MDVDLTVTDATGATGTTTGTVRFLYEQANFSQTLKCPPRVDVVGPLRMAPTASVAANGTVTVIGACPSGSPVCLGSLVLRRTSTASSSARRRRASRAVLARTKFAVPPAHRMRLKLRLNRRGRALMRHHRRLVVRAVTSGAAFGDAARPRSSRLTLVRKKRR